jgi:O-antigen/teichoic acid export membrane protein
MNSPSEVQPQRPEGGEQPPGLDVRVAVERGTRVVLAAQVASQLVSLAVLAVMLRLVTPAQYGLVGMVLPAVMLPRMAVTLGPGTAILSRALKPSELTNLFWTLLVAGLVATAITAACGPLLAEAYGRAILGPLCLALAGTTFLTVLGNQHEALLQRRLQFLPLAGVRLLALACGGFAGIYAARRGAGVWALVAQAYGEQVVLTVWVWLLEPWRPGWPDRTASIRQIVRFSSEYSLSQIVYFVAQNLDKILLPLVFGAAADRAVGLYGQAFSLMMKPVYLLTSPLTGVMVTGLSQVADPEHRQALLTRFYRLVAVGLFPCAAGLTATAPDAMRLLGGNEWQVSGWILVALAPAICVLGLSNLGMLLLASAGKGGRVLAATALLLLLLVQGGLAGIYFGRTMFAAQSKDPAVGGALGLAIAWTAVAVGVWSGPYLWFSLRSVGIRPSSLLRPLWPSLRAALLMGLLVWALAQIAAVASLAPAVRLPLLVAAGVPAYGLLARGEIAWAIRAMLGRDDALQARTPGT